MKGIKDLSNENWQEYHNVVLTLTEEGKTAKEIAEQVNKSASHIHKIRSEPFFRRKLSILKGDIAPVEDTATRYKRLSQNARNSLYEAAPKAAKRIFEIAQKAEPKASDRIVLEACKDILDRAGLKPIEVIETHERSYTPEEIDSANRTIQEMQAVVMRLTNQESRFVLPAQSQAQQNPDTDESSEANQAVDAVYSEEEPSEESIPVNA